jgi:CubicO group peptidase (beta-lactamase class C family)
VRSSCFRGLSGSLPAPDFLVARLARRIREEQADKHLPSVAAAALRDGEVVWSEAVGLADVERSEDATADHQYRIASITKTFTAVAIMQLRDAGKLSLDDSLEKHIPGAAHSPTLRLLLSHASGLQREPPGRIWETLTFPSREELVGGLADSEQVLPAGAFRHYSNLGFALLGEVVARVAGADYERYVDERVIKPLGLQRTTWRPDPPVATGYFVDPWADVAMQEPVSHGRATAAAGELWSTAPDLCRWASFLADPVDEVLTRDTVEEMHAFQTMTDLERWTVGHGLALMLMRKGERVFSGHSGAHLGFLSNFALHRPTRTGAAVVTNSTSGVAITALGVDLADLVADSWPADPRVWQSGDDLPDALDGVLGAWWSEGLEYLFRYRDGRLEALLRDAAPGQELSRFAREGEDRYRAVDGLERGELLRVIRDESGKVVRLELASYPFTRRPEPMAKQG